MARLIPAGFADLLGLALEEHAETGRVFGLPRRSFRVADPAFDLAVDLPGGRAGTPIGPAAGPHTQLAHNLAAAWLAGARAFELKTVQADDRLEIPRPCIAAGPATLNVEWSQELRLDETADQYVAAWLLIHVLRARGLSGAPDEGVVFDASVGYDLDGIRSEPMTRFLDALTDAGAALATLRAGLPPALAAAADVPVPGRVVGAVTVSTFHGCPPEQIEAIVGRLFARHAVDVIVKVNPTLLGFDEVEWLMRGRMGRDDATLDRAAFEGELGWREALDLIERLRGLASRHGRVLGLKAANTLVVRNLHSPLPGRTAYLSGRPLRAIAATLASRLADATSGHVPIALSGGIDAASVADAVAAGLAPVTACTDLLQPSGYRRLPGHLAGLVEAMRAAGASTIAEFALARARERGVGPDRPLPPTHEPGLGADAPDALRVASLVNLRAWSERVSRAVLPEETAHRPPRPRPPLASIDCDGCNRCALVCPNVAFLRVRLPIVAEGPPDIVVERGAARPRPAAPPACEDQWVVYAGFCNACGACDAPCPQQGPPHAVKPRFHVARDAYEGEAPADGVLVEAGGARLRLRLGGREIRATFDAGGGRVEDGVLEVYVDAAGYAARSRVLRFHEGHVLPLARVATLRRIVERLMAVPNPVRMALRAAERERIAR
jgi:putative selenate reductase